MTRYVIIGDGAAGSTGAYYIRRPIPLNRFSNLLVALRYDSRCRAPSQAMSELLPDS